MPDLNCCGKCCGAFSTFAIFMLLIVQAVVRSGSDSIQLKPGESHSAAANTILEAAGMYFVCVLISVGCIIKAK
jgi:hypothetical protein